MTTRGLLLAVRGGTPIRPPPLRPPHSSTSLSSHRPTLRGRQNPTNLLSRTVDFTSSSSALKLRSPLNPFWRDGTTLPATTIYSTSLLGGDGSGGATQRRSDPMSTSARRAVDGDDDTTELMEKPANLLIDPRVTCSPYYGLRRVIDGGATRRGRRVEEVEAAVAEEESDAAAVSVDAADDYRGDDDEDDGFEYYDPSSLAEYAKPRLAVPLPERLHVQVVKFAPPDPGENVGTIHLSSEVFGCNPIRTDIIHRVVVYQRNKKRGRRNGGARTKTIGEVSGSGRKVRPQKGTGRARAGHSRPAHWRGGAKAHGPKGSVQDYTTKLNKKVRKMGLRMALSQKLYEGNLVVVDDLAAPTHRTNALARTLGDVFDVAGRHGTTALLIDDAKAGDVDEDLYDDAEAAVAERAVLGGVDANLRVASKNLHKVKVLNQLGANVYDVIKYEKLIMSLSAIQALEARL